MLCLSTFLPRTTTAFLLRSSSSSLRTTFHRRFTSSSTPAATLKKVLVPIADGSEEIESVTIIDVLVRAGATVTVASVMPFSASPSPTTPVNKHQVTCSRGVKLVADKGIDDCLEEEWDLIACPGGLPGAEYLRDSSPLLTLLTKQEASKKYIAAICASPAMVLQTHGFLKGKAATCFPAERFTATLEKYQGREGGAVVVDGHVVTSQGPGTTMAFALTLVELLFGMDKAKEVAGGLLVPYPAEG
eukprot:evm.model.NODE_3360_length_4868_cov_47.886810.1